MKDIRFAKFVVFVNGGVPLALLAWDACRHHLGANPVNFAILTTGMLTLVFLMLTLLVTPIRKLTGWNWLIFSRRTFGLYAFFYGCTHFLIFFALDRGFSVPDTLSEMVKRKYLVIGSLGLLLMVPLAVTSTNAMIKRLGAARWRLLHRLVYVAAIAGTVHFYMQVKADVRRPLAFAGVLTVLLGYRAAGVWRGKTAPETPVKSKMWSGPLRVAKITLETPDVRTFRLVSPEGGSLPFQHLPGQYLALSLMIKEKRVIRTYTIASSAAQSGYCEVTIKRETQGLVSRHLHDTLRENDLLQVSAPAGRFTFVGTEASSVVLIAGGVGITPLMAIARHLTDTQWPGEIYFVYSAKTARDIIFRQELEDLQKKFANLHLVVTLTNADAESWAGRKGRITKELLTQTIPKLSACPVFICGPTAMMDPMKEMLRSLGVPEGQIHTEAFVAVKRDPGPATVPVAAALTDPTAAKITFSQSGKSAALSPEKSLLETAEACGLNIDYECRSGICGRCKTRLLAGNVTMEVQDALSDRDKAENLILMCQAKATENVTVEA